jgi:hypothetical protein
MIILLWFPQEENLLDILGLAHRFVFVELETAISDYLKATLSLRNVCCIYDLANMYSPNSLCSVCKDFMDRHASEILTSESFLVLSLVSIDFGLVWLWLLLYTHTHRSILGAADHILTPANQLMVMGLKVWSLSNLGSNQ